LRIEVPFEIEYLTPGTVPIDELIDSLTATRYVLEESGYFLPSVVEGLRLEHLSIGVRSITHTSPLRELFLLTLVVAFQKDLTRTIPPIVDDVFRTTTPEQYKELVTVVALMVLFYGVGYVKDVVAGATTNLRASRQLDAVISEIAERTGYTNEEIRTRLRSKFASKNSLRELGSAALRFFKPSKSQNNSPVVVGGRNTTQRCRCGCSVNVGVRASRKCRFLPLLHGCEAHDSCTG
jgi:hypothetical protein